MSSKDAKSTPAASQSDVVGKKDEENVETVPKTPQELEAILLGDLQQYVALVKRSAVTKEVRFMQRALRLALGHARTRLHSSPQVLRRLISSTLPASALKDQYLSSFSDADAMELEAPTVTPTAPAPQVHEEPEVSAFLGLLTIIILVDDRKLASAQSLASSLIEALAQWNKRTLDPLSARLFYFFARSYELEKKAKDIRVRLLQLLRTATLKHNYDGQVVILNLLLRSYVQASQFDQAAKLAAKTEFKQEYASSNEAARYHYYLGRIYAIQLKYSDAFTNLQLALRKGPRQGARGFRSSVTKFSVIVQLLLGEIPDRGVFRSEGIRASLTPYLQLTKAVRNGSISEYEAVLRQFESTYRKDNTWSLIGRLRHNVIKTGLKKINSAYSRISFQDICAKLNLDSEQDAEYLVAKAIRDGIIDAEIDHSNRFIQSLANADVYSTNEPQKAFSKRVDFLLKVHNDAVTSMRYPEKAKKEVEEEEEKKDEDEDLEDEIAEFLADDDD